MDVIRPKMEDPGYTTDLNFYNRKLRESEEEIARLQEEVEYMGRETIHDWVTSLYSTSYFYNRLNEEIIRSERYRHFLTIILLHVELVRSHSTQQISMEIKKVGLELNNNLMRRSDIVAVFGKRQMVIMLPETDARGTQKLMQRYQAMFPNSQRRLEYSLITYPNDASNIEMIVNRLQELSEDLFRGSVVKDKNKT